MTHELCKSCKHESKRNSEEPCWHCVDFSMHETPEAFVPLIAAVDALLSEAFYGDECRLSDAMKVRLAEAMQKAGGA